MKLTKQKLKQIIKEELTKILKEGGAAGHYEEPDNLQRDISNVASYINAWFNEKALNNVGAPLSKYLRMGAEGKGWGDTYWTRVSFKKALEEVAPENVEEFKELFMKLADGIEQNPSLLDSKKIGKKGDWYGIAQSL